MRRPIADTLRDIRGGEALEDLSAPHKVLEASFREVWTRIETGCKTSILLGTPE